MSAPAQGRTSLLPTAERLAQDIRNGRSLEDLATTYRTARKTIAAHLTHAGYNSLTGMPKTMHAHRAESQRLKDSAGGVAGVVTGGDGGDHGLPTHVNPIVYTSNRARFRGLDWDEIRRKYEERLARDRAEAGES